MFYEGAQTIGPGWQRSFKPSNHEEMSWSPSSRHFRSPGSSPETHRREHDEFPTGRHRQLDDDEFFRKSPTFPRRMFRWEESPSSTNHRFGERPRMFKRVFKPNRRWEEEFNEEDLPHLRRFEREFDKFDRPSSRKFDDRHFDDRRFDDKHFDARDFDRKDEFDRPEGGKVHHIPIRVERRTEGTKSQSSEGGRRSPEEENEDWTGPGVQRLKKAFETADDFLPKRFPSFPAESSLKKSRAFSSDSPWDPHLVHTLPTRRLHKASQSMDDSKHPVSPKYVSRSYSETHEDVAKPQQQRHSAAFRSHSDGHCPNQTSYVTKIDVNMPTEKDQSSSHSQNSCNQSRDSSNDDNSYSRDKHEGEQTEETDPHLRARSKKSSRMDSPSLQQIAVVMQNVDDLIVRIEGYTGTGRDKQYRFLDEMLTRCMIRLDGVDTEGREDVRNARRAAIRDVQACIDRLEAKADQSERRQQQCGEKGAGSPQKTSVDDHPKDPIPLGDGPKMAIPLGPAIPLGDRSTTPIPLGDRSTTPIPLGDRSTSAIPLGDRSTTPIPLGDRSTPIPLGDRSTKAIPLGDRSTTPIPLGDGSERKSYSRQNSGNGEQTKL